MRSKNRAIHSYNKKTLSVAVAVAFLFFGAFSGKANAIDWGDIDAGSAADWNGPTGGSSNNNFLNMNSSSGNTLTIQDANTSGAVPSQINGAIYGGYSSNPSSTIRINTTSDSVSNNAVTIYAPSLGKTSAISGPVDVFGGFKYSSSSTNTTTYMNDNSVVIHSGVDLGNGFVAGANLVNSSDSLYEMNGNHVTIYGGTMGRIAGALADVTAPNLSLNNNSVTIDLRGGGILNIDKTNPSGARGDVFGADFHGGTTNNNSVTFYADDSSTITSNVRNIYGGRSGFYAGEAAHNKVLIDFSQRTASTAAFGDIRGGSSGNSTKADPVTFGDNIASDNTVDIYGNPISNVVVSQVVGGLVFSGTAENNKVYLVDVEASDVIGGYALDSILPSERKGVADNNQVNIVRGRILGGVYGGWDASGDGQSANNNSVTLTDVAISGAAVYGGYSNAESKNNTVAISGYGMSFTDTAAKLAGGNHGIDGNKLITSNTANLQLGTIENFEHYVFNMTSNEMGKTVYSVATPVDFTSTDHVLNFNASVGPPLQSGQVLVLIDNTVNGETLTDASFVKKLTLNMNDGFLYNYDTYFGMKGNALVFEVTGREQDDRNITFGQAQLAGLQMVELASDLARSIPSLVNTQCKPHYEDSSRETDMNPCDDDGTVTFAGVHAGSYNWDSGHNSRVDLNHFSMLAGAGRRKEGLLLAGFFEAGRGEYDAKVHDIDIVDSEPSKYVGIGALLRYEEKHFYGEVGLHTGQLKTDFDSSKFGSPSNPVQVEFGTKSTYAGVDAILGYKLEINRSTIDLSSRYSWNHVSGDDFMARDVTFNQGSINSHRVRTGIEWSYNKEVFHPYAGLFYEYEFDGKSDHKVLGEELRSASQKGSSGIGKLGLQFKAGKQERLRFDASIEGHVGALRGYAGKLLMGYEF